jgi:deazaflavin-dependent oxidoreductase (nitroreductase family)
LSRVTRPALRGSLLGAILRLWNPAMRVLLGSPLHWPLSRWFAILAWTGRRSGRRYSTPISYIREGNSVYATTADRWWRNLRGGAAVAIRIAGRWHSATAIALPESESRTGHARLFRQHPWLRRLAGVPGRDGGADQAALDRVLEAGRVLVRIDLAR